MDLTPDDLVVMMAFRALRPHHPPAAAAASEQWYSGFFDVRAAGIAVSAGELAALCSAGQRQPMTATPRSTV